MAGLLRRGDGDLRGEVDLAVVGLRGVEVFADLRGGWQAIARPHHFFSQPRTDVTAHESAHGTTDYLTDCAPGDAAHHTAQHCAGTRNDRTDNSSRQRADRSAYRHPGHITDDTAGNTAADGAHASANRLTQVSGHRALRHLDTGLGHHQTQGDPFGQLAHLRRFARDARAGSRRAITVVPVITRGFALAVRRCGFIPGCRPLSEHFPCDLFENLVLHGTENTGNHRDQHRPRQGDGCGSLGQAFREPSHATDQAVHCGQRGIYNGGKRCIRGGAQACGTGLVGLPTRVSRVRTNRGRTQHRTLVAQRRSGVGGFFCDQRKGLFHAVDHRYQAQNRLVAVEQLRRQHRLPFGRLRLERLQHRKHGLWGVLFHARREYFWIKLELCPGTALPCRGVVAFSQDGADFFQPGTSNNLAVTCAQQRRRKRCSLFGTHARSLRGSALELHNSADIRRFGLERYLGAQHVCCVGKVQGLCAIKVH